MHSTKASLALLEGALFSGKSFGADRAVAGEVVFNTGMVGYPQSLTDPSYRGQILVITYPLVGNYGVTASNSVLDGNWESEKIQVAGVIIADYCEAYSHWDAKQSLSKWLKAEDVPGLTGVDTRKVTQVLREQGSTLGKITFGNNVEWYDPNEENLVRQVSCKQPQSFGDGEKHVAVIDCGLKYSIIRNLTRRGVKVTVVPWDFDVTKLAVDGLMISNGPGDPSMVEKTIEHVRRFLDKNLPTWGICMGNQVLAQAAGAKTYKLRYGHRSQNQPCIEVGTKRCIITSQNHGFAVDAKTLPSEWEEWFVNANDGSNEGIRHKTKPFRSVQFHPEAMPGPVDAGYLFDEFVREL